MYPFDLFGWIPGILRGYPPTSFHSSGSSFKASNSNTTPHGLNLRALSPEYLEWKIDPSSWDLLRRGLTTLVGNLIHRQPLRMNEGQNPWEFINELDF